MLQLRDFAPAPHLRPYVQRYILTEGVIPPGEQLNHLLIPGLTEIVYFNLSEDVQFFKSDDRPASLKHGLFAGQLSRAFEGTFQGRVKLIGAHMYTPAVYLLFKVPMRSLLNDSLPLEDLMGSRAVDFCNQLREQSCIEKVIMKLDSFLTNQLRKKAVEPHATLLNSLAILDVSLGSGSVKAMSQYSKVSPRTLQKIFMTQVGLTPKEYCRMYRFSELIRMVNENRFSWKRAVEDLGYYDQAHFLNDFKSITGLTPSSYLTLHPHVNKFITDF